MTTDLRAAEIANNARSRDGWASFAGHRRVVTSLLRPEPGVDAGRLCVLGAGNANDLDLATLLAHFAEVHLVDLDAEALALGVARQGVADHPGLDRWGGVDVTGVFDAMAGWTPGTTIGPEDLARCAEGPATRVAPSLPGPFDLVASTCLLSQLIRAIVASVGEAHPRFPNLIQAIRSGHLRLLADLLEPGGSAVLITDVVSSETCPGLASLPESRLPELPARLANDRNFFHGVNPVILAALATLDPALRGRLEFQGSATPWRWDLGPRLYLVCAWKYGKS